VPAVHSLRIIQVEDKLLTDTSNGAEWPCVVESLVPGQVNVYRCASGATGDGVQGIRIVQVGEQLITSTSNGDTWTCNFSTLIADIADLIECASISTVEVPVP